MLVRAFLALASLTSNPDINHDMVVDQADLSTFKAWFVEGDQQADYDQDGFVSGDDYDKFNAAFKLSMETGPFMAPDGWYRFPIQASVRVRKVTAASGTPGLNAAIAALNSRECDAVSIERGGLFPHSSVRLLHGGRDAAHPLILFAYGSTSLPRPIVEFDSAGKSAIECSGGGGTDADVSNVVVASIEIRPTEPRTGLEPCEAIRIVRDGTNWLFQDVYVHGAKDNVNLQGATQGKASLVNVVFNRCAVTRAWEKESAGHSQGFYSQNTAPTTFNECVVDHNGWKDVVDQTIFNHDWYLRDWNSDVTIAGCLIARASASGINMQMSGRVSNNLFYACPVPVFCRTMNVLVENNVILSSTDINAQGRGMGIFVGSVFDVTPKDLGGPCTLKGNLIAHKPATTRGLEAPIRIGSDDDGLQHAVNVTNTIVFDWATDAPNWLFRSGTVPPGGKPDLVASAGDQVSLSKVPLPSWPHPERDLGGYARTIGFATAEEFLDASALNRFGSWDVRLTAQAAAAWVRAGFVP